MGTRLALFILAVTSVGFTSISQEEEQRKYVLESGEALFDFVNNSENIGALSTEYHSKYSYYDLYIDTPDLDLYQKGFSLRFRKRFISKDTITYGFQLKSEMASLGAVRMEVEETELDYYRIKENNEWVSVSTLLARFFQRLDEGAAMDEEGDHILELLHNWIRQKATAAIAPFQKLRTVDADFWTEDKIGLLQGVLYGKSIRMRSHVYIDPRKKGEFASLQHNQMKLTDLSPFLAANLDFNWVIETSLDSSTFYPTIETDYTKYDLFEFEVENKYMIDSLGTMLMDYFELKLLERFALKGEMASKYKQSINYFF